MVASIVALFIFVTMFVLIVQDKIERQIITLVAGLLMIVVVFGFFMRSPEAIWRTLNIETFATRDFWLASSHGGEGTSGINWATILFIAGMMILVEGMGKSGFFNWLCLKLARFVNYRPMPLMLAFMTLSFFLSMFIDSITVILFLAAITVELAMMLHLSPTPLILTEIFCSNLGGSATMSGDPPNIIIGSALGYTFFDFAKNTGFIALVAMVFIVAFFYLVFRKKLSGVTITADEIAGLPAPESFIKDRGYFIESTIIFFIAVILLITHAKTHLTVPTIGVIAAVLALISARKKAWELVKGIDYKTLLFFVGLFIVVSGLEETGVLKVLANWIGDISGGSLTICIIIILWISALASAIVDNIPFSATMVPVIKALAAASGLDLSTLAWALSIGTDIGGNGTPIGASANVVGISIAAKNGTLISWKEYCKYMIPATLIVCAIGTLILFVRHV